MSSQFPVLLAWTFLGSFLLALLKTSRWTAVLISVVAVWIAGIEQSDIDRVLTGTVENYAWFAALAAAVWFPTAVVSLVGADLGTELVNYLTAKTETESEDTTPE